MNFYKDRLFGLFLSLVIMLPVACEENEDPPGGGDLETSEQSITNGHETKRYKSVGLLSTWCTGTLIEERTVLTAGHCAKRSKGWFEVGGRKYNWSKNHVHPDYPKVDLGVIILAEPVRSVTPSPLNRSPVSVGKKITMVAYGSTNNNGGNDDMSKKYVGTNTIDGINWRWYWYTGPSYNCGGDSGGASFIGKNLVGVIFSGDGNNCSKTTGWDMRVDAFIDWIESKAAGELPGGSGAGDDSGNGGGAKIEMSKSTYAEGEKIIVKYSGLPGNKLDWIGLFRAKDGDKEYVDFKYTKRSTSGTMKFKSLSSGRYMTRLYFDNSFDSEATARFKVGR